jgi:hypothetical protein
MPRIGAEDYLNDNRTKPRQLCYQIEEELHYGGWIARKSPTGEIWQRDRRQVTVEKDNTSFKITVGKLVFTARNPFPFMRQTFGDHVLTEYIHNGSDWLKEVLDLLK